MSRRLRAMLSLAVPLTGCNMPDSGSNGTGHLTVTVNGVAWTASAQSVATAAIASGAGVYSILVSQTADADALNLSMTLYNISGPGTYPLGVDSTVFGGIGVVSNLDAGWATPLSGAAGTITVDTLTSARMTGTFSFTANALSGGATGTRVVSGGDFDLPIVAVGRTPVPDQAGSAISTTISGIPWNAAAVGGSVSTAGSASALTFLGSNLDFSVALVIASFTGIGSYALGSTPGQYMAVSSVAGTPRRWGGTGVSNSGTVSMTSATATRVAGTFSVTLPPDPTTGATGTLTLNGTFTVGLKQP